MLIIKEMPSRVISEPCIPLIVMLKPFPYVSKIGHLLKINDCLPHERNRVFNVSETSENLFYKYKGRNVPV